MAIPSDEASCVAWHEAYNEPEGVGGFAKQFSGLGGLEYGPQQSTTSARPEIVLLGSGRRAYRFNGSTQLFISATAKLLTPPFTIIIAYASTSTAASDRRTIVRGSDATGEWILGARSNGKFNLINASGIVGITTDTTMHTHTVLQDTSGTMTEYRIDGSSQGTSASSNCPGQFSIGGSSELPQADVLGFAIYTTKLTGAALTDQEAYWATGQAGTLTVSPSRLTQMSVEAVRDGTPNVRLSQQVIESVHGANPNLRMSQQVIEVVNGASPNVRMSQLIIEVVHARRRGYNWAQLVG